MPAGFPCRVMTIASFSERHRYSERLSFTLDKGTCIILKLPGEIKIFHMPFWLEYSLSSRRDFAQSGVWLHNWRMKTLLNNGGCHYFVSTQGNGRPLILLHGFTGSSAGWGGLTAVLAPHYRLITIDLPGHGRTDSPPDPARYRMENVAADLTAVLQKILTAEDAESTKKINTQRSLRPLRFNLLGYSMGGRLALYIALHYPHLVQSLILESASPGLETPGERAERRWRDEALAEKIEREGIRPFVNFWERLPLWDSQKQMPDETRQALRQQRLQNNPAGLVNSLRGMGTGVQPSLWPRLGQLEIPVLLLAGEFDAKFVDINRKMAAQIPGARLEIVPEAGHTIHLERPSDFTSRLLHFLTTSSRDFGK